MENGNQINCTEKSLTLLAACYMQVDLANNWPKIIEILDYGGIFFNLWKLLNLILHYL